jgi:hypothetical protein
MQTKTLSKLFNLLNDKFQREFNLNETLTILKHNKPIWWSWSVLPKSLTNFKDQCLLFKVQGQLFNGFVAVTLGWEDLYHVHFISNKYVIKESIEGVYFDVLVDVIDRKIETK